MTSDDHDQLQEIAIQHFQRLGYAPFRCPNFKSVLAYLPDIRMIRTNIQDMLQSSLDLRLYLDQYANRPEIFYGTIIPSEIDIVICECHVTHLNPFPKVDELIQTFRSLLTWADIWSADLGSDAPADFHRPIMAKKPQWWIVPSSDLTSGYTVKIRLHYHIVTENGLWDLTLPFPMD